MNNQNYLRFSLRMPSLLLEKLGYIAEYNGRSKTKEIEMLVKRYVESFEKKHGEISDEDINQLNKK